jgi:PKHD-type hydroxylase
VGQCRGILDQAAEWRDGRVTAGTQSRQVKNNLQLAEDCNEARSAGSIVMAALKASPSFFAAALPRRIFPPLFNRYCGDANFFGSHVDNAIRASAVAGAWLRTDLSATLFLSSPDNYDGGELVIEHNFGEQRVKLSAGDLVLYPASSVHRVEPVTRGARLAAFFWVESLVREDARRRILFDMDGAIVKLREGLGDSAPVVSLTGCYHNLLRMWAQA